MESSSSLNWSKSAAIFSWSTCGTSERPPLAKYESTAGSRFQSNRLSRSVATRSEAPVKVENCLTFSFCMRRAAEDMAAVDSYFANGGRSLVPQVDQEKIAALFDQFKDDE